jgi:hypothetical protein
MDENSTITEKFYDQYLFNLLSLIVKLFQECNLLKNEKYNDITNKIFGN